MRELTVGGIVTRRDTDEGVHGLTVEAWDDLPCEEQCLGSDVTNRDGSYLIRFCPPQDGCPAGIFVKVRDRDGRLIHDGRRESCACRPDAPTTIDVALAPETLWWHLASPVSWNAPDGPLIDPRVIAEVDEAIATLLPQQTPNGLALCAVPPIQLFDGLLADAWLTLQGDLAAARRFRDVLDALCGSQTCGCTGGHDDAMATVREILETACPPRPECGEPPAEPARPDAVWWRLRLRV